MEIFFRSILDILNEMSPYILLGFILAGFLHVFVPAEAMTRHLSGGGFGPVIKAALFGIPLPLCSCGVLPTAVALRRSGASKGATTSFLIATPQTGVDSIAATWSLLGPAFAVLRPIAALVGAVAGGWVTDRISDTEPPVSVSQPASADAGRHTARQPIFGKIIEAVRYGLVDMVASVGKWLVIGLIVAAAITALVPDEFFVSLSRHPFLAMIAMIIVAVPMYVCATGSIPIALSLMMKGVTPGVAFVLLMAGPAANFASAIILGRAVGRRATAVYIGSVIVTALAIGITIDYLLPADWFMPAMASGSAHCHAHGGHQTIEVFPTLCSLLLVGLLVYSAFRHHGHAGGGASCGCCHSHTSHDDKNISETIDMKHQIKISGMSCPHCQATVAKTLARLAGASEVDVNLSTGIATVNGDIDLDEARKAIENAGFDVVSAE